MEQPSQASKLWSRKSVRLIVAAEEKERQVIEENSFYEPVRHLSRRFCVDKVKLERQVNVSKPIGNMFSHRQMGFYMAESLLINGFAGKLILWSKLIFIFFQSDRGGTIKK